ncbi:hypothetical protein KBZ10_04165 [Streptomyces sp. F63]|uniref:hypothetical protein n=1 Tax=Streptomyces sp. F63 TaxID=2824887 RepID=UPI001B390F3F|nr:hypothetical protein [Streptomyces sp. F63]MBQ0983730.1 hypothetical protein [Streptomyces sp. F63]
MTTSHLPNHLAARFPLIHRPHLAYPSLAARIEEVRICAHKATQNLPLPDRVNSACAVWNLSALILSDCGMPDLAACLCLRQHRLFQPAWPVTGDLAIAALQPVVNLIRLTARAGERRTAYQQLMGLHQALHHGGTVTLHGRPIDFTGYTTPATLRHIKAWIRILLLEDGTRLLASTGQWEEAARHATAYDDAPDRLHDSRQAKIVASLRRGDVNTATTLIGTAIVEESWEAAVAEVLRLHAARAECRSESGDLTAVVRAVERVMEPARLHTRMFRVRLVLATMDLAPDGHHEQVDALYRQIIDDTEQSGDAFAAREILRHATKSRTLPTDDTHRLTELLRAAGLGHEPLSQPVLADLHEALKTAEAALMKSLADLANGSC